MNQTDEITSFGQWLKQRRKSLDMTQRDLAARIRCSPSTIEKLEAGKRRPSRQVVDLLADCFGMARDERTALLALARNEPGAAYVPSSASSTRAATNIPGHLTPFIERHEVAEVQAQILSNDTRLLTLTGPPGIGKTSIALRVAASLLDGGHFDGGVFFVALAPITDPGLVADTIARVLGLSEDADVGDMGPLRNLLIQHIGSKRMLLLLDNFEQVLTASPLVSGLLSGCPGLKILVTSREALHLHGEQQFSVGPMGMPDPARIPGMEDLQSYPAIALFVQRARLVNPDFRLTDENAEAVAAICAQLDGLPLAIELIAARTKLLAPQALLSRLDSRLVLTTRGSHDLPERHQTLHQAIASSYDLLEPGERLLFARMAVFVGGCSLAAVEAVCNAYADLPADTLDCVASLVDKSLLRNDLKGVEARHTTGGVQADGEPRLTMLETIREYALERLASSGEASAIRRLHAEYYLALAEAADPQLRGAGQVVWLGRLEREHDNMRAALSWALESGDVETAARIGGALWRFWDFHSHLSEGRRWLDRVLEIVGV